MPWTTADFLSRADAIYTARTGRARRRTAGQSSSPAATPLQSADDRHEPLLGAPDAVGWPPDGLLARDEPQWFANVLASWLRKVEVNNVPARSARWFARSPAGSSSNGATRPVRAPSVLRSPSGRGRARRRTPRARPPHQPRLERRSGGPAGTADSGAVRVDRLAHGALGELLAGQPEAAVALYDELADTWTPTQVSVAREWLPAAVEVVVHLGSRRVETLDGRLGAVPAPTLWVQAAHATTTAVLAARRGKPEVAARLATSAAMLYDEIGDVSDAAIASLRAGPALRAAGDAQAAEAWWQRGTRFARRNRIAHLIEVVAATIVAPAPTWPHPRPGSDSPAAAVPPVARPDVTGVVAGG